MIDRLPRLLVLTLLVTAACAPAVDGPPARTTTTVATTPKDAKARANVVRGRVLDHDGRPLKEGWARIVGPDNRIEQEATVDPQGGFSIVVPEGGRAVERLHVSGVGYRSHAIMIATQSLPADVSVRLGTTGAPASASDVTLAVSPSPLAWARAKNLTKGDGFYEGDVTLPDGKYPFELEAVGDGGTVADGYVAVTSGKARVAFDLAKRPAGGLAPVLTWGDPNGASAGLTDIVASYDRARTDYETRLYAALKAGKPADSVQSAELWAEKRRPFAETARTHREPLVRQAAAIVFFSDAGPRDTSPEARELARKVVETVPPAHALWGWLGKGAFWRIASNAGQGWDSAFVQDFVANQSDQDAVLSYLAAELRAAKSDVAHAREVVAVLKQPRFAKSFSAKMALRSDPDALLAPGKPMPAFDAPALVGQRLDERKRYGTKQLEKKLYLLDVWATWCNPCVAELPKLHELYATYGAKGKKGRRLEILSVSIDHDAAKVTAFRKDPAHPMPWLNAVADDTKALFAALGYDQGTTVVPFYALVDEDGKLVASTPELTGATLASTIERVMATPRPPTKKR